MNGQIIIITSGLAASGKTTIMKRFAADNNWFYIDKDDINDVFLRDSSKLFTNIHCQEDRDGAEYIEKVRIQSYICAIKLAAENAKLGKNVIIDGYFGNKLSDARFIEFMDKIFKEIKVFFVYFKCSKEELMHRLLLRNYVRDWQKIKDFEFYHTDEISVHEQFDYSLRLDTEKPVEENVSILKNFVNLKDNFPSEIDFSKA